MKSLKIPDFLYNIGCMKQLQFLSYEYPDLIKVLIGSHIYTYRASEFLCWRLMKGLDKGGGFHSLNYFKRQAQLISRQKGELIR